MLEKVKRLLGLTGDDKKDLIDDIVGIVTERLKIRLGVETVPTKLEYIVIEVSVSRYNKIGNEGMKTYGQEGESISFNDLFADYEKDIEDWKSSQGNGTERKGGFKFL